MSDKHISKRGKRIAASRADQQWIGQVIAEAEAVAGLTGLTLDQAVDVLVESGEYAVDDPWILEDYEERHGES